MTDMADEDTSSWYRRDVEQMERRIKLAVPDAECERLDYGFGLDVSLGGRGFTVMRPARPDSLWPQIRPTAEEAIEKLNKMRNN